MPGQYSSNPDSASQQAGQSKDLLSSAWEQKRKYRRHPKPDEHAPEKPPSAYVIFSNKVREEVKGENLSFTEIARLAGERWQKLDPAQKDLFESHAAALKGTYNAQLVGYKNTGTYQQYMEYLADFKTKHSGAATSESKRPKLEPNSSSGLSAASQAGSSEGAPEVSGHVHGGSVGSLSTMSYSGPPNGPTSSTVHVVISLPSLPGRRSPLQAQSGQERHMPGCIPNQSLILVEGSNLKGFESSDALSRAAQLFLSTPPTGTPPPSATAAHFARHDRYSSGAQLQQFPAQRSQPSSYSYSPSVIPSTSAGGNTSLPAGAGVAAQDSWRDRPAEASRQLYAGAPPWAPQNPVSMPILQLAGPKFGDSSGVAVQRILPPLQQNSNIPLNAPGPFSAFGTPTASGSAHQFHSPSKTMASPHGQQHNLYTNTSESEAVYKLAGPADRPQHFDPARTSRSNP